LRPQIITITNQKGGTGKTTLTALLAYGLASRGHKVLLLDLDPQSHLSSFFLKINQIENVKDGVLELASGEKFAIKKVTLGIKGTEDIGLIPSGINYILKVYKGEMPAWDPNAIYKRVTKEPAINQNYDYIICDTPPELFPPTIWGLYAADYLIVPTNLEELSLAGIKILFKEVIPDIMISTKKDLKVLGVAIINVIKKYKKETIDGIEKKLIDFIKKSTSATIYNKVYKKPFFNSIIHRHNELKDLVYRPRRWEMPLSRVINSSEELKNEVFNFVDEIESRIKNFEGVS
jgi:chromosome partitioning protein